ncbi:MAG: zinc ribbon domain-containing protein [Bacilli bacterium]|nr:zinc ribbon domain-containing protein [Bacilli bacterium]
MFCDNCGNKMKQNAKFCSKCGKEVIIEEELSDLEKEERDIILRKDEEDLALPKKDLLEYLDKVKDLEVRKMALENSIWQIESDISENEILSVASVNKERKPEFNTILLEFIFGGGVLILVLYQLFVVQKCNFFMVLLGTITGLGIFYGGFWTALGYAIVRSFIICAIVATIMFIINIMKNVKIKNNYNKKLKEETAKVDKENKHKKENLVVLKERKNHLNKQLGETKNLLNKIYDLNVIYPKYRNLIPITMFIEYLSSNRCRSLYNYTGCYNVYEQELLQKQIIGRLDIVIDSLNSIRANQMATYNAIVESNRLQSEMIATTNSLLNSQQRTEALAQQTNENTRITKENTAFLTYIECFK